LRRSNNFAGSVAWNGTANPQRRLRWVSVSGGIEVVLLSLPNEEGLNMRTSVRSALLSVDDRKARGRALLTVFIFGFLGLLMAITPQRSQGISMHMLPKGVADLSGAKWGLTVDRSSVVIQTTEEFLDFYGKQNSSIKENGVWIVVTNPAAYSDEEKSFLEDIKSLCAKEKIVLFVARASELPNGWKRYDAPN
jgi:hypothetical protein